MAGSDIMSANRFDDLARSLAAPMSRRKAVGVMAGTLLAGTLSGPRAAFARVRGGDPVARASVTCQAGEIKCSAAGGAEVCAPPGWVCCSNDKCAIGCRPYKTCAGAGVCHDTEKLCSHPDGGYARSGKIKFCSQPLAKEKTTCLDPHTVIAGWCCGTGMTCGPSFGDCTCPSPRKTCDVNCCLRGEYCEFRLFDRNTCEKLCPDGSEKCNGVCCTGLETCGFGGCSCKPGLVSCGTGRCCAPPKDPGDPDGNAFSRMRDMLNQTAGRSGGGAPRSVFARPAQSGTAAIDGAMIAIAMVNGQGAAAQLAIRGSKRDNAFRSRVRAPSAKPPTVVVGPGLDAASAAALNKLLAAEAKANALILATARALWRARGAAARRNRTAAKSQLRAAARFAGQAATALRKVQPLRDAAVRALEAGKVAEVYATEEAVAAALATLKTRGIPPAQAAALTRLGVGAADQRRLRSGLQTTAVGSSSGAGLIEPLKSRTRSAELQALILSLSQFASRARRHPIAR